VGTDGRLLTLKISNRDEPKQSCQTCVRERPVCPPGLTRLMFHLNEMRYLQWILRTPSPAKSKCDENFVVI
jgi:hypothetical protein